MKKHSVVVSSILFVFLFTGIQALMAKKKDEAFPKSTLSVEDQRKTDFYFYEAVRQRTLKNYPEAAELLSKCYYLNPNDAAVLYEFGVLYSLMGQVQFAQAFMENAMKKDPSNVWYKMRLAELLLQSDSYNESIAIYENIVKNHPEKEEINYMLASLYKQTNQLEKSITSLNKVEQLAGVSEEVSFEKYRVYTQLKQPKKANAEIDQLIKRFPSDMRYRLLRGSIYVEEKQYEKALALYLQVKHEDPGNAMLQNAMAEYYTKTGKQEEGKGLLKEAFLNPKMNVDDKLTLLGQFLGQEDQSIDQAEEYFSVLLNQYPENEALSAYYVSFLLMQGKGDEAIPFLNKMLAATPQNDQAWSELIGVYLNKYDFEKVLKVTNQAISSLPNNAVWYFYKSMAEFHFEKYNEAIQTSQQGLSLVPDGNKSLRSRFYSQIGDIYAQTNQIERAFEMYEQGLQANENNIALLNNYAYYLSVVNKDLSKAESMSAKTVAAEPKNSTYLDTYAWIFFMEGNYTLAKLYIEQAVNYDGGNNDVILEHCGDIYFKAGAVGDALKYWKKALEKGSKSMILKKKIETKTYIAE